MNDYLGNLTTESVNERTKHIDECSTTEILMLIDEEDSLVAGAVKETIPKIAAAVDTIVDSMKRGGRLFYFGAGTSGRLGVLDASECPPTYGVDPELVQGYIAGGDTALRTAVEGSEDSEELGESEIAKHHITEDDVVVGIAASGRTPYVIGVIRKARKVGAYTIGVTTNSQNMLGKRSGYMYCTGCRSGGCDRLHENEVRNGTEIGFKYAYNNNNDKAWQSIWQPDDRSEGFK